MTADASGTAGVLVVRVWFEEPDRAGLRARISTSLDLLGAAERVHTTTDPQVVLSLVADWLAALRATRG